MARAHEAVLVPILAWELPGGEHGIPVEPTGQLRREWHIRSCQRLHDALIAVWGEDPSDPLRQPQVERGPAGWALVNIAQRPGDVLIVGAGPVLAIPPPALAHELRNGRVAWALRLRPLTPEQILRDQPKPAA
jgi:hypothetical protein